MSTLIGPVYKEVTLARELKDSQGLQAKFTGRVLICMFSRVKQKLKFIIDRDCEIASTR